MTKEYDSIMHTRKACKRIMRILRSQKRFRKIWAEYHKTKFVAGQAIRYGIIYVEVSPYDIQSIEIDELELEEK